MNKHKSLIITALLLTSLASLLCDCQTEPREQVAAKPGAGDLEKNFVNPPDSARPGVYWYFMNGNLNGQEMTADLESMKEAGLGNLVFLEVLRAHGLQTQERALPDHAVLTPAIAGAGSGSPVLMTEKDAVKCTGPGWQDAWFLEVEASVDAVSAKPLLGRIAVAVAGRTQGNKTRE